MERFKGQKYEEILKDCQDVGVPWSDPTFSASDTSIGHSKGSRLPRRVKWLRPSVRNFYKFENFMTKFLT